MRRIKRNDEKGGTLAEMALCIPVFLAMLCGMLDLGQLGLGYMSVDDAAYAACRTLAANPSAGKAEIDETASAAAPMLSETLSISTNVGEVQIHPYVHNLPSGNGGWQQRESSSASRSVTVVATATIRPLTAVGSALAAGLGNPGGIEVKAVRKAEADATVEGGTSPW